jgi:hypothetical protein
MHAIYIIKGRANYISDLIVVLVKNAKNRNDNF